MSPWWTPADQAELDVLVYELVRAQAQHNESCRACQPCPILTDWREHLAGCPACRGDAPLTYGPPCERRAEFVAHGADCLPCNHCPSMQRATEILVDWREGRSLRSKAEWFRACLSAAGTPPLLLLEGGQQ